MNDNDDDCYDDDDSNTDHEHEDGGRTAVNDNDKDCYGGVEFATVLLCADVCLRIAIADKSESAAAVRATAPAARRRSPQHRRV